VEKFEASQTHLRADMIQDAVPLHVRVQRYGPYLMPPHVGTLMWSPEELKAKEGTTASSL